MFGLALLFVYVFLFSFLHFDHIGLGRGSWSLCSSCKCLLAMHTLFCVTYSLPPGVEGWLRLLLVAIPGLFCLPLPCSLSTCFFSSFSILIILLREEGAGLCAYRAFVC